MFMPSVTEVRLNKVRARFRARFAPNIWANSVPLNLWGAVIISLARKNVHVLSSTIDKEYLWFNWIAVTGGIKINEQSNPIDKGSL